jgi:hypothetical protein
VAECRRRLGPAPIGSVVPDLPMYAIYGSLKVYGVNDLIIFGFLYWQNWWQVANAIGHNFWLWGGILLGAILMRERRSLTAASIDAWDVPIILSASALLHTAIDFLCHREDAHMSFWPVTNWKFISPVSYWDPSHYGHVFQAFETLLGLLFAIILFLRFRNTLIRILLGAIALLYIGVPLYWRLTFG